MIALLVAVAILLLWHAFGRWLLGFAYIFNLLVAVDQLGNALIGGMPDETISAHAYRARWQVRAYLINWLFRDKDHCWKAYLSEVNRLQLPPEYRTGVTR